MKATMDICPDCIKKEQELLKNINDYCFGKTSVTLVELAKEFNEPIGKLEKYILDRKLVQVMDQLDLICKGCGVHHKLLSEGRLYCKVCFEKLGSGLASTTLEGAINPNTNKPYSK